jgi:hypothetical protein
VRQGEQKSIKPRQMTRDYPGQTARKFADDRHAQAAAIKAGSGAPVTSMTQSEEIPYGFF